MFAGDMLLALIPVVVLVAMFALAAFWISRRSRMRELAHRERLAMIEKGLLPPAELFPGGAAEPVVTTSKAALRFRTAGVMFVGIGVALAFIIGVAAGTPRVGLGLGGAIVALGVAMIVNGVLGAHATPPAPPPPGVPVDFGTRD